MEKLHKRNLIIVWCSVVALSLVSLMGYGFTVLAIRGIAILVVAGIISTIGCYLSIDDVKKVLILVFPPAIGTLLYSWVYGGNSIPYLANFVLLAMTTSYFMESVIIYFAVPFTVISVVFMIFSPETIAGSDYSMAPLQKSLHVPRQCQHQKSDPGIAQDRKSTRLNSSHMSESRMPSSA